MLNLLPTKLSSLVIPKPYDTLFIVQDNPFLDENIITNPRDLLQIAEKTLGRLNYAARVINKPFHHPINSALFNKIEDYIKSTRATLTFLIKTIKEDIPHGHYRILDPQFINEHFSSVAWHGSGSTATNNTIRLSKYLAFCVPGSRHKTAEFPCALYALPDDELNFTEDEIRAKKNQLLRFRFTRREIFDGALEKQIYRNLVKPLAWVSQESCVQAMRQGTIIVQLPSGEQRIINVHRTNGHPYDQASIQEHEKKQYWFFHCYKTVSKNETNLNLHLAVVPGVTLAGDMTRIGLGQTILLRYLNPCSGKIEARIGILADTGGHFKNNVVGLDYFAGIFNSKNEFYHAIQSISDYPQAYILIKKKRGASNARASTQKNMNIL